MNLSFKFKEIEVGEFGKILRPIIPVSINSDGKSIDVEALIDSGSDGCVLPKDFAEVLGIKVGKSLDEFGIGGEKIKAGIGRITLSVTDGKNLVALHNVPVYVPLEGGVELEEVIIGREPFFRDFDITFKQNSNRIILERARRA